MVDEFDIWRAAAQIIKHYGDDAPLEASERADAMLAKGDLVGQRVWKQVLEAIDGLQSKERLKDALLQ